MGVTRQYRQSGEQVIATYNYTDIADGTGVQTLYGFVYSNSAGTSVYVLTSSITQEYSTEEAQIETDAVITGLSAVYVKELDLDFDLKPFNLPRNLRGVAQVNCCMRQSSANGQTSNAYVVARVRKWDGTTETEIASGQSYTIATTSTIVKKRILTIPITIPKGTHFKKGEILRVTLECWGNNPTGGGSCGLTLGHDFENRDGALILPSTDDPRTMTKVIFKIPFDLDL